MRTFYIYHVPGYKVGATTSYIRRSAWNFRRYGVEPYIIDELELPDTPENWQIVGDLEWEYADEFGYDRGQHYAVTRKNQRLITVEQLAANGRAGGRISKPNIEACSKGGRISKPNIEECSKGGKIGGKAGAVAATKISMAKGTHVSLQRVKCPHCDMVSTPAAIGNHIKAKH